MIKLVAFDWNGTLLADTKPVVDADNVVLKKLGLKPITVSQFRNAFTIPLIEYYANLGIDEKMYLKNKEKLISSLGTQNKQRKVTISTER